MHSLVGLEHQLKFNLPSRAHTSISSWVWHLWSLALLDPGWSQGWLLGAWESSFKTPCACLSGILLMLPWILIIYRQIAPPFQFAFNIRAASHQGLRSILVIAQLHCVLCCFLIIIESLTQIWGKAGNQPFAMNNSCKLDARLHFYKCRLGNSSDSYEEPYRYR